MEKVVQRCVLMLDIMLVEFDGWIMGVTLIPKMLKNLWKYESKVDNERKKVQFCLSLLDFPVKMSKEYCLILWNNSTKVIQVFVDYVSDICRLWLDLKIKTKLLKRVKNFKKSTLFPIILVSLGVVKVLENNNNSCLCNYKKPIG